MLSVRPKRGWHVSLTGALIHSLTWLMGTRKDVTHTPFFVEANGCVSSTSAVMPQQPQFECAIYCIHGTADRSLSFSHLISQVKGNKKSPSSLPANITKIHLIAFSGRLLGKSIRHFAQQLKQKIIKNNDKNIILMGHSRGGLVAAELVENLLQDSDINVHGVITICTPFGGSSLALRPLSFFSRSIKEMQKNSEYLQDLRAKVALTNKTKKLYYYFGVENDAIVATHDSYVKEHCHSVILIDGHGHLSVMRSKILAEYILDCLLIITERQLQAGQQNEEQKVITQEVPDKNIFLLYAEINSEIERLRNRVYLRSQENKIKILTELNVLLADIIKNGYANKPFANLQTLGDLIKTFSNKIDEETQLSPKQILREHLNYPFSIFRGTTSTSSVLLDNLIREYADVPLPTVPSVLDEVCPTEIKNNDIVLEEKKSEVVIPGISL